MLLRLLGIASQKLCDALALTALLAAGSVCAFESERRAECLEAMAAVAAVCEGPLRREVVQAFQKGDPWHMTRARCIRSRLKRL